MKIKVCGLKDPANLQSILALPIDMAGFIFYPKSPRFAEGKTLRVWMEKNAAAFGRVEKVGVFVNAEIEYVLNTVHDYQLDYVQLHGSESPEYCRELLSYWSFGSLRSAKFIKAFSVSAQFDFNETAPYEGLCAYFLFDAKGEQPGGNGTAFNWELLENYKGITPFLLSGGINENDAKAIKKLNVKSLWGVDINSLFETKPGFKDAEMVARFVKAIREE